jgi:aryl-alcohol dehydrogenase (NADP+)
MRTDRLAANSHPNQACFIWRALEAGINFIDTADMYSSGVSEEILGRAIRDFAPWEDVVIATKDYFPMGDLPNQRGLSRKHILQAIDASLRRLGIEYVDLYQIHRWDDETPMEEMLEALHDVVGAGKALYLGASSMYAWQFAKALCIADRHGWSRFVSMQNHYNLVYREEEREMIALCAAEGVGLIPWSPLARGFLAGNRTRNKSGETARSKTDALAHRMDYNDNEFAVLDRVIQLARRRGVAPAQLALAWMLHKPHISSPIVGASKMSQLEQAIAAVQICLTPEEMDYVEAPYQAHPLLGL